MKTILKTFLAATAAGSVATAAPLAYEGFGTGGSGYTADATINGSSVSATGFGGGWTSGPNSDAGRTFSQTTSGTGLTYTGYAPNATGSLSLNFVSGSDIGTSLDTAASRAFSYASPGSSTFYMAFLVQSTGSGTDLSFFINTPGSSARDSTISYDGGTGQWTSSLGSITSPAADNFSVAGAAAGSTNLIILEAVDANTDSSQWYDSYRLWINPTINTSGANVDAMLGAASFSGSASLRETLGSGDLAWSSISMTADFNGSAGQSLIFDEFVITTDINDIIAIPEPGTFALMGLTGAAVLFGLRRRKR